MRDCFLRDSLFTDVLFLPDTAQMKKWELCNKYGGDTIAAWLATDPVVKGVKFSGKCVQCLKRGRSPR